MGASKSEIFTEEQNNLAGIAKSLAHPARIAILEYLLNTNACVCGTIVDEIGLAQATVSQHLKELKKVGLIQGDVEGSSVNYCINPKEWEKVKATLFEFMERIKDSKCC